METYIIRIYRFQKDNPHNLVGIVESVEGQGRGKMAFTNFEDLWEILNSRRAETLPPGQEQNRQARNVGNKPSFEQ